jgi:hypothetical protein
VWFVANTTVRGRKHIRGGTPASNAHRQVT